MGLRTPLYDIHVGLGAKMVDFGGWDMPLHYGSQIEEHHAVRRGAGVFDVSHMAIVDLHGSRVREFLRHLLANDVAKLQVPGKGLYSCLLREDGGVLDDLIVYAMTDRWFRVISNASTREKDLAWIRAHGAAFGAEVRERRDLAMVAVQGPEARVKAARLLGAPFEGAALGLKPFVGAEFGDCFVARTGYTGEEGFEIAMPADRVAKFWRGLSAEGVTPVGLGARDTLRLEAGLSLYGNELDETHDPFSSNVGWTVSLGPDEREFIGRAALLRARAAQAEELVGLVLDERGVLRGHQLVQTDRGAGSITSGSFAPTLNRSIALARVPLGARGSATVDVRGKALPVRIVAPPFVRHGRPLIPIDTAGENS
jgi:aminomethyltransferase